MSTPKLTIVIGANGAGKTTWCREHRASLPKPFYNADSIAEGLGDANDPILQRDARRLVDERIRNDLEARTTFGFESTYSGRSRPNIVRTAKGLGYTTIAIFLGTRNAEVNISRVRKRVSEGGHHVEPSEVRRRWTAAWTTLIDTWEEFDTVRVLDTSGPKPIEIARKNGPRVTMPATPPNWARGLPQATLSRLSKSILGRAAANTTETDSVDPMATSIAAEKAIENVGDTKKRVHSRKAIQDKGPTAGS